MENLTPLSIDTRFLIAAQSDTKNLIMICNEILAAPILKEYRPRIYEMAEKMHYKISTKQEIIKEERSKNTPCCNMHPIYCQCNFD